MVLTARWGMALTWRDSLVLWRSVALLFAHAHSTCPGMRYEDIKPDQQQRLLSSLTCCCCICLPLCLPHGHKQGEMFNVWEIIINVVMCLPLSLSLHRSLASRMLPVFTERKIIVVVSVAGNNWMLIINVLMIIILCATVLSLSIFISTNDSFDLLFMSLLLLVGSSTNVCAIGCPRV